MFSGNERRQGLVPRKLPSPYAGADRPGPSGARSQRSPKPPAGADRAPAGRAAERLEPPSLLHLEESARRRLAQLGQIGRGGGAPGSRSEVDRDGGAATRSLTARPLQRGGKRRGR